MTVQDKKKQVLALLSITDDSTIIEEVYDLLYSAETAEAIPVNELTPELQSKIDMAMDDYKSGSYITHEEMKQKLQKWLSK